MFYANRRVTLPESGKKVVTALSEYRQDIISPAESMHLSQGSLDDPSNITACS